MNGEMAEETGLEGPMFEKTGELFAWALKNDNNSIVRHEICYQIAGRNMRKYIPNLVKAALHDKSELVRHEAVECLSIIHAFDYENDVKKLLNDSSEMVRETATFVLKRMARTRDKEYDRMMSSF